MKLSELKQLIRESIKEYHEDAISDSEEYLYTGASQITNAGDGLFTAIDIYKGEIISEFKGEVLTYQQSLERKKESGDDYFMDLPNGKVLDCKRTNGFAKYANDAEGFGAGPHKNNARIELVYAKVCLVATKNIKANSEIFVGYGKNYWNNFKTKHAMTEEVNNELPKLVLLVGIPGSGKSTWINSNKPKWKNTIVISPDNIRRTMLGDVSSQADNKAVFDMAKNNTIDALKKGTNVVLDATNVNTQLRKNWVNSAQSQVNCKLQAKLFWVDKEKAYQRISRDIVNKVDRANVPKENIDVMYIQFLQSVKHLKSEGYEIIRDYLE